MFVVFLKHFVDVSTVALKSEHIIFLYDFIVWPKRLGTDTTKTEKSRDRNGQTETAQTETARPNRLDRKVAYPRQSIGQLFKRN